MQGHGEVQAQVHGRCSLVGLRNAENAHTFAQKLSCASVREGVGRVREGVRLAVGGTRCGVVVIGRRDGVATRSRLGNTLGTRAREHARAKCVRDATRGPSARILPHRFLRTHSHDTTPTHNHTHIAHSHRTRQRSRIEPRSTRGSPSVPSPRELTRFFVPVCAP